MAKVYSLRVVGGFKRIVSRFLKPDLHFEKVSLENKLEGTKCGCEETNQDHSIVAP